MLQNKSGYIKIMFTVLELTSPKMLLVKQNHPNLMHGLHIWRNVM